MGEKTPWLNKMVFSRFAPPEEMPVVRRLKILDLSIT
jgi:hypothetical protein